MSGDPDGEIGCSPWIARCPRGGFRVVMGDRRPPRAPEARIGRRQGGTEGRRRPPAIVEGMLSKDRFSATADSPSRCCAHAGGTKNGEQAEWWLGRLGRAHRARLVSMGVYHSANSHAERGKIAKESQLIADCSETPRARSSRHLIWIDLARLTDLERHQRAQTGQLKNLISGGRRPGGSYGSSAARPGSAQHDFRAIFGDNCEACRPLHSRLHGELRPRLRLARLTALRSAHS